MTTVAPASPFSSGYRRALGIPENAHLAGDPQAWVDLRLNEHIWSKQREIVRSVNDNRYTAVQSAHDTGKSFISSRLAAWWLDTRPDPFIVSTAPTWKQVNSILWREMRKAHRKGGLQGRINLDAEWYFDGDELVGFGRKPADYDQAAFQGIHALNVLIIIDEACGVPQSIFEAVDSLATNERARVLAIGNPDDPSSYFAEVCKPGSGWNTIQISAFDTPAYTEEVVPELLYDLLISRTWVEERKKRWGVKSPIYQSKVLGRFPEVADDQLISPRLIREAQEREITVDDKGRLGVDVARYGDDETAIYRSWGSKVRLVATFEKQGTMDTANQVAKYLRPFRGTLSANIDIIGVGGGVYDRLRELNMNVKEFNSSSRPWDTERFHNRRAEAYWHVRELAEHGELDLPENGEDDDLVAQLGSIKWKLMPGGKIAIESKEDMKERGLHSPDRADAAVMALWKPPTIVMPNDIDEPSSLTEGLLEQKM